MVNQRVPGGGLVPRLLEQFPLGRLDERLAGAKAAGVLETGTGACPCNLAEPDLWGRYRITGESTPPFAVGESPGIR